MASDSSGRFVLLNQLADEFATRYRRGERPGLQEYIDRHPQLADDIREFFPAMVEMEQVKEDRQEVSEPTASGPLPPLERLGDFRIIREIGHGGMGVVYEAEQESLGRHVALKVLPKQLLVDARTKQRFEREAKVAARLHHTNIVPVFGVGEHEGLPYYVMQFIPGLGLDEVLQELKQLKHVAHVSTVPLYARNEGNVPHRAVSAADVARSLLTGRFVPVAQPEENAPVAVANATVDQAPRPAADQPAPARMPVAERPADMSALSSSSVVLPGRSGARSNARKPTYWRSVATIGVQVAEALEYAHKQGIVHRDVKPSNLLLDTCGTVWVTDLGLAKADDQQNLTHTGDVLGTLRYMSPEAFDGKTDARSDVYSLGLTLYELLALRPAFGETDRHRLIKQVTTAEPARLGKLNPQVPRDLETVVHKAIDRDPARRYQSAGELAADLQRFVDDEPVRARPVGSAERFGRWCRRNPLVAALTAAVAFLLVAGTTVATYFAIDATLARNRADSEALNATNKAKEALENAQKAAEERANAISEKERADREADAARANLYVVRVNTVQVALDNNNLPLARDLLELLRQPDPGSKQLPGWEWHYHWRFCHNDLRTLHRGQTVPTLRGHSDRFSCVAFSPDGARLASSADDGTVRLWDPATGRQLYSLTIKKSWLPCVAFSPDGTRLAVGTEDGTVRVLDADRWQELRILKGHTKVVRGLAFSPDGARLFTVSEDRNLKIWDVAGGQELRTLHEPAGSLWCVAVSPDGKWLAQGGQGATVRMLDAASGREVRTFAGHTGGAMGVAFSPDGRLLASAGKDRAVRVWDVTSGQELHTLTGHTAEVRTVAFSPDGTRLASAGHDQTLKVWDMNSGQEVATYLGHARGLYGLAFSPDGRLLASASSDGTIKLWDPALRPGPRIYQGHDNQVRGVAFSPDGQRLASIGLDGRIKVWDALTGQELPFFSGPGPGLLCMAFSPDGRLLATAGDAGMVTVRDAGTGRTLWAMKGHTSWLNNLAFSPDSRWLASAGHDRTIKLWDTATGQELRILQGHKRDVKGLVFSHDGARLFSGSDDETVKLWDPATGQELQTLKGHAEGVTDIALSPDGHWLASASHDQTVKVWDLASGRVLRTLKGHNDTVWSVVFHPDGTRLATAGWDQTVRVWDTATGFELAMLKGHTDRVLGVAFSPDGGRLASAGGMDLSVRVWDGQPLTPDTQAERASVGLLDFLFARPLRRADVIDYLRDEPTIGPQERRTALALAQRYREEPDPQKYHAAAWPVIRHPYSNVFLCQFALAQMNAACERAADNATYRSALGIAQYRLGKFRNERYADALATLTKCDQNQPATLGFLAMTQHQLGRKEQARTTLSRLRELLKEPPRASTVETEAFLGEAAGLIEGK